MDIKGYKIHHKIGQGAMAGVYLAEQESLGRKVALKVLSPALAGQGGFTQRFLKEGKIIAYLKHPQIVSVYDLGSYNHNYYLAMEFLSGGTLEQRIKAGLSPAESVQLIIKISEALSFAHKNGVIHRDIKSQNIMFRNDDIPVLTDFGIARLMDNDPQLTVPGRTMGSPLFMSPEQICGGKIDARADLYSVGILFYKMLTNKLPYHSDHILTIALMHKTAPLPVLPDELSLFQPVLNRLLAKSPDERYSCAQDLIDALNHIASDPAYHDLGSHTGHRHFRPEVQTPTLEPLSMAGVERSSHTEDAPQPGAAHEPGEDEQENQTCEHTVAQDLPEKGGNIDEGANASADEFSTHSRDRRVGKIVSVLAAAMLVMAVGLYSVDTYLSKSAKPAGGLSQPAVTSLYRARIQDPSPRVRVSEPLPVNSQKSDISPVGEDHQAQSRQASKSDRLEKAQQIESLLAQAQKQLANYRLTSPKGDNCYETYEQLVSLDPSGEKTEALLKKIGQAYGDLAQAAQKKGSVGQSLSLVSKGLSLLPKDTTLLAMQDDLRMKVAEQDRIKREQAIRIEEEKIKRAAELASMERRLKAERQMEAQRRQEAERARIKAAVAVPEIQEPQEVEVKSKPSEPAKKPTDNRKRLFGTF